MEASTLAPEVQTRSCPKCALEQPADLETCARCGVVFAKLVRQRDTTPATAHTVPADVFEDEPTTLEPEARRALAIGAVLAAIALVLPFIRFVFSYMTILVHELGHAIFGWLFGYPSVPAFDFYYGGGVTSHDARQSGLLLVIFVAWAGALYAARRNRAAMVAIGVALAVYGLFAFTSAHEQLITFMGHGAELVFAGIFFYRALSGFAVRVRAERPLYAFLGFFIVASVIGFSLGLVRDPLEREIYGEAKGGGHWMDLSRLAHDLGFELTTVAGFLLLCAVATLPLTWVVFKTRRLWSSGLGRLLHGVVAD